MTFARTHIHGKHTCSLVRNHNNTPCARRNMTDALNHQNRTKSAGGCDTPPAELPCLPGTYILFIALPHDTSLQVGCLGTRIFQQGLWAYAGSAHGPGGLRARVSRHLRENKPFRWHIDALTLQVPVTEVWYTTAPDRLECVWAKTLADHTDIQTPIPGFGSSDCACTAHLFALPPSCLPAIWGLLSQIVNDLTRYTPPPR